MRRQTLGVFAAAALGVTLVFGVSGVLAKPGNGGGNGQLKPRVLANKACHDQKRALQREQGGKLGNQAFKGVYGDGSKRQHAMRNCKRQQTDAVKAEAKNAAQECRAERADENFPTEHGATFEEFYGTNENGSNAFGKCVSGKVRAAQAEEQEDLLNAAQACHAEKKNPDFATEIGGGETFQEFYGTNHNQKNAFGKCVSKKAHEAENGDGGGEEEGTS